MCFCFKFFYGGLIFSYSYYIIDFISCKFYKSLKLSLWNFRVSDELSSEQKMDIQVDSDDIEKASKNFESNSLCYSSGNEELDSVLTDHLLYCTKLISVSI